MPDRLKNITIGQSALTNNIYLYRKTKIVGLMGEKRVLTEHETELLTSIFSKTASIVAKEIFDEIKGLGLMLLRFDGDGKSYTEIPFNDTKECQDLEPRYLNKEVH